jgi:hypothetical protein
MTNQQTVIYIILSAILLYLYYLKRELSIFMAFAVVVIGTLILEKESDEEGFGLGGGGVDKKCAKIGFKPVKINDDDINGSLKKVFENFKSVTSKYVTYSEKNVVPKDEYKSAIDTIGKFEILKSEMENLNKDTNNQDYIMSIILLSMSMLNSYLMQTAEEPRADFIKLLDKLKTKDSKGRVGFELVIKGGEMGLKVINNIQKSDEMKAASKEVKNAFSVITCTFKQVLTIWKKLEKSGGGGGGDGEKKKSSDDDDE